jgi:hypothetical protein
MAEIKGSITIEGGSADLTIHLKKSVPDKVLDTVDDFALAVADAAKEAVMCTPMLRKSLIELGVAKQAVEAMALAAKSKEEVDAAEEAPEPQPPPKAPPVKKKKTRRGR